MGKHGDEKNPGLCVACEKGRAQDSKGQNKCFACEKEFGLVPNEAATACKDSNIITADKCKPDEYLDNTSPVETHHDCSLCPDGAFCRLPNKQEVLPMVHVKAREGFWRVPWMEINNISLTFVECFEPTACIGATANTTNISLVKEGCDSKYTGPKCGACSRSSYRQAASFKCLECFDDQSLSILFIFFVIFCTLALIIAFTLATVKDGGEASAVDVVILKIAINSGIISAGAASFPLKWPPVVVSMFQVCKVHRLIYNWY